MSDYRSYQTWEDLLEEEDSFHEIGHVAEADASKSNVSLEHLLEEAEVPEELKQILAERKQLEAQMDQLLGRTDSDPDDARKNACFPVKIHTKATRIEEKRQLRRDQQIHAANSRAMAKRVSEHKLTQSRLAQQAELAKSRRIQKQLDQLKQQHREQLIKEWRLRQKLHSERELSAKAQRLKVQIRKRNEAQLLDQRQLQQREAAAQKLVEIRQMIKWQENRSEKQNQTKRELLIQQLQTARLENKRHESRDEARKVKALERIKERKKEAAKLEKRLR